MQICLLICLGILLLVPILARISVLLYRKEHEKYVDDGKPIPNQTLMEIHCSTVHTGIPLYQYLECGICPYKEECKNYELRYKRYPNGMVDSRRIENNNKGDKE